MSNWFEHELDDDETYSRRWDIDDEVWADTALRLGPRTLLWAHLHYQDLTEDKIKVTLEDFETARCRFINCGYPLVLKTFNDSQLIDWLDKWDPWLKRDSENYYYGWIADMDKIADLDTLTDNEIVLVNFDERAVRDYLALLNLQVDWRAMAGEPKVSKITPRYFYSQNDTPLPYEEMKQKVKTWKHVPKRYRDD